MHKKAKRQPRKPVNLFAKKCTTCAKGNTARALRSRPSRSACQKLAVRCEASTSAKGDRFGSQDGKRQESSDYASSLKQALPCNHSRAKERRPQRRLPSRSGVAGSVCRSSAS